MRPLLALLVLVLTLSISGISSAMVASVGDDCCADGAGEFPADDRPDEDGGECPPFCHACACSPSFAVPLTPAPVLLRSLDRVQPIVVVAQLPPSPPLPGVFHPPRHAA